MSSAISPLATLIDLARRLLEDCRALAGSDWPGAAAAAGLQDRLEQLADYAANLGHAEIQSAALDLYAWLGVFVEGPLSPNPQQLDEWRSLVESLAGSLRPLLPEASRSGLSVLAFAPDQLLPGELRERFAQQGLAWQQVADGDELATLVRQDPPALLLVDHEHCNAVTELLDQLTDLQPAAARVPIIAFGSSDAPREQLRALVSGAELHVGQLDEPGLPQRLAELLQQPSEDPYRVLVVDDDRQLAQYCERVLRRAGMAVECARDGDGLRSALQAFRPELILMDLYLPGEDGMSLTAQLRRESQSLLLPVIFLSGEHSEQARARAIAAGGDDYLTKPVRPRNLIVAVQSRIRRARAIARSLPHRAHQAPGALLRKGDFLAALGEGLQRPGQQVLLALTLDQAEELEQRLGLAARYQLEQAIGQRLLAQLAEGDRLCLWRDFGFGVLLQRDQRGPVLDLAERLRQAVASHPFMLQSQESVLTLSIGMALRPRRGDDLDDWIGAAFAAQAAAQRLGGNRCEGVLGEDTEDLPPERLLWIRELVRLAASGNAIAAEFQPLLPLHGRQGGHYVLLMSLRDKRHPLQGVARRDYLRVARELGVNGRIERLALFRALEALDEQRARGRNADVLVPLDLNTLDREQLTWLERELARRDLRLQRLSVEVDAALLLARPALVGLVKRLRQLGVRVHAAESGGLAALLNLRPLPLDGVRLPVASVLEAEPERVAELVGEWHALDRTVTLQAVDEVTQLTPLWNLRIDYLQGDAVATPGPRLDFDFGDEG